jgi:hypothetical protein
LRDRFIALWFLQRHICSRFERSASRGRQDQDSRWTRGIVLHHN